MERYNILVVEDDQDINRLLCKILEDGGYCCRPAFRAARPCSGPGSTTMT